MSTTVFKNLDQNVKISQVFFLYYKINKIRRELNKKIQAYRLSS
jgi:hypothetical protein